MRWSQLKQRVEANFAPRVRGRVELFQTRYRHAADSFGEAWIVVDGERQYSWGDINFIRAEAAGYRAHYARTESADVPREAVWDASRHVQEELESRGIPMRWILEDLLVESLSLGIKRMLTHRSPILRGLAVLDRGCGKRRLAELDARSEHPFVRGVLEFRRAAEGMRMARQPPQAAAASPEAPGQGAKYRCRRSSGCAAPG
jgi:hypothetical protein